MTEHPNAAEAWRLRAEGMSWKRLSKHFGVCPQSVRQWIDPEYAAKRKEAERNRWRDRKREQEQLRGGYAHLGLGVRDSGVKAEDLRARLAEIPPDTRTPVQKLMGDPPFERSALYQRERK